MADLEWNNEGLPITTADAPPKSARAIARETRDRPWEKNLKLGTAYKRSWQDLQQDNTWGGRRAEERRSRIFARKPWQELEQDLQGLPYEKTARRVFKTLQPENPGFMTSPLVAKAHIDREVLGYLRPSMVEKSLDLWQEIKDADAFLGQILLIPPYGRQCQPEAHMEGCLCKLLSNSGFEAFLQNIISTVMSCYLRYVDQAAQYSTKRQQMRLMFWLGLSDAYTLSRPLIERILLARPQLVYDNEDCELDPVFLEEFALFQAIIAHDFGRVINLAEFEGFNEEQKSCFTQYKTSINELYHKIESHYRSNMSFEGLFRSDRSQASSSTSAEESRSHIPSMQSRRDWRGYVSWYQGRLRPVVPLEFGFTSQYIVANANEYAHLLDPSTGQFSFTDACEVSNRHLSKIYHALEDELRKYMCVTQNECLLVKAKQIFKQKWPVTAEVIHLMELILRYRKAAHTQFSADDLSDRHGLWDDMLVEVKGHLARSARAAFTATSPYVEQENREALHGYFNDSISKRWNVNRWSVRPFIATVKSLQYYVSR